MRQFIQTACLSLTNNLLGSQEKRYCLPQTYSSSKIYTMSFLPFWTTCNVVFKGVDLTATPSDILFYGESNQELSISLEEGALSLYLHHIRVLQE